MSRPSFAPLALAALLVALACNNAEDPLAVTPGDEAGRYALRSVNGRPVPAVTDSTPMEFGVIEADTVILDGKGGVIRALSIRRESTQYGTSRYVQRFPESYRLDGTGIEIGFFSPCPPGALCVENEKGTLVGSSLALARSYSYKEQFQRVGP